MTIHPTPPAVEVTTRYEVSTPDGTLYTDSSAVAMRRAVKHNVGVVKLTELRTTVTPAQVKNLDKAENLSCYADGADLLASHNTDAALVVIDKVMGRPSAMAKLTSYDQL